MNKGMNTAGGRNSSPSNDASRASANEQQHDDKQLRQGKSIKPGSENAGKRKKSQGGEKR